MDREQIEGMIREYQANVGRCAHLDTQIRELEQGVRRALSVMIEEEILPGIGLDGMPHGNTVRRPTEEVACKYADGYIPEDIQHMQAKLERLAQDREGFANQVSYVDAWMKALNEKQRWIIRHQMIDQESWREIASAYTQSYGEIISKNTLKRMKDRAMDIIVGIAETAV